MSAVIPMTGLSAQDTGQMVSGLNMDMVRRANAMPIASFNFQEPKTGVLATLFPSEATWHPLYKHSKSEITDYLTTLTGSNPSIELENAGKEKIKKVVIDSYEQAAYSKVYLSLIISFTIILLVYWYGADTKLKTRVIGGAVVLIAFTVANAVGWARSAGEAYWSDFEFNFNGLRGNGTSVPAIRNMYYAEEQAALNRQAIMESNRGGYSRNSTFSVSSLF